MDTRTCSATRSNALRAIEAVITLWLDQWTEGTSELTADQRARIEASAATMETLVERLIETIRQTAVEFDQAPASVQIDGLRPIESGWRVWGTVSLIESPVATDFAEGGPTQVSIEVHDGQTTISLTYPGPSGL